MAGTLVLFSFFCDTSRRWKRTQVWTTQRQLGKVPWSVAVSSAKFKFRLLKGPWLPDPTIGAEMRLMALLEAVWLATLSGLSISHTAILSAS